MLQHFEARAPVLSQLPVGKVSHLTDGIWIGCTGPVHGAWIGLLSLFSHQQSLCVGVKPSTKDGPASIVPLRQKQKKGPADAVALAAERRTDGI